MKYQHLGADASPLLMPSQYPQHLHTIPPRTVTRLPPRYTAILRCSSKVGKSMDDDFEWRYEQLDGRIALVADNLPGYRAEIRAVFPAKGLKMRVWIIYEQQHVIAQGSTTRTDSAKRACTIYLRIAKRYPLFDRLPPLNRTTAS